MLQEKGIAAEVDVLVVGAGFGGMYMLHRARLLGLSVQGIEAGGDVGGTWYWNRYPGARCDIQSLSYSYSFSDELQQEWKWPERYAAQADILRYANHVADRFDLRRSVLFDARVVTAHHDPDLNRWRVVTDTGHEFLARFCVMATGCLSVPKVPDIEGLETFRGAVHHTADWPREGVDFSGKRVGLIGTGSSGIQSTPIIAAECAHLTVFQRTANFSIPGWNGPMDPREESRVKEHYAEHRTRARRSESGDFAEECVATILEMSPQEREAEFEKRWRQGGFNFQYPFTDALVSEEANEFAADFVRRKIRETVKDPLVAEMLCPKDHPIGTKRLCVDTGYFETFNRPNVTLVDLKATPIETVAAGGIRTAAGMHELDAIVLATGFDAMTGALARIDIRGEDRRSLAEEWKDGPATYLGVAMAGFPNLFVVTGPGSPSVLTNVLLACEQHVEWIADLLAHMRDRGLDRAEAVREAQDAWMRDLRASADRTLYPRANSWYVGANVPGKPRVFMPYVDGFGTYARICETVAADGYPGIELTGPASEEERNAQAGA